MATALPRGHEHAGPTRWGPGRVAAVVLGSLGVLVGVGLLLAGLALVLAHATLRDSDGFYASSTERLTTSTRALTSERLNIGRVDGAGAGWAADEAPVRVRVRAASADGRPIFVGIASERSVDAYLRGVAHDEVTDVHSDPFRADSVRREGDRSPAPPASEGIWEASSGGSGTQTAEWKVGEGRWAVVVMNADGRPGIATDVSVGARLGWLVWVGVALLVLGLLSAAGGGGLMWAGLRTRPDDGAPGPPAATAAAGASSSAATIAAPEPVTAEGRAPYPVVVEGRLDEPLSRWLWLVKWLLAVPHWIVLGFLWMAVAVLWFVALVVIAITGRYPRAIFDFNLGVLRWTWRVAYYATHAIASDRYPPFTLAVTDYPAEIDVPYPERLSRGKVLVKWWLLAIPHLVVVGVLLGGWNASSVDGGTVQPPGLLPVLVLIAGIVLLFTGRFSRDLFELILGINRWVLRVAAYVLLMRDEYPPFRLGR
jgi:hypothetical protein